MILTRPEDLRPFLGLPYVAGGDGPESYDCGGLVVALQEALYGRRLDVPPYARESILGSVRALRAGVVGPEWQEAAEPLDSDLALMSQNADRGPHHVGAYVALDGGRIVHTLQTGRGSIAQRLSTVLRQGWRIWFYHWTGGDCV